jgi:hypothetical protein
MIWICYLKRRRKKEMKEDSNLMANWTFQCLVALKRRRRNAFSPFSTSPNKFELNLHFFSFDFKVLFSNGSRPLLMHFLSFPWPINYNHASWCNNSSTHSLLIWFWVNISFLSLEIMALCMGMSFGPQAAQVNEEPAPNLSLN